MKKHLLLSACALALIVACAGSASAAVSGTVGGSYAGDAGDGSGDMWNVNGSLLETFGSGGTWGAEETAGYHNFSDDGSHLNVWNLGGSAFWQNMQGRLAATVNYYGTTESGIDIGVINTGVGGEWYGGRSVTLVIKGGAETLTASGYGNSGSQTGEYAGGMVQWYVIPNISLSGAVDYYEVAGTHTTAETGKIEWMFSDSMPLSIYGGYEHADVGTGGIGSKGNLFFAGLKFYFNGTRGGALVDRQRSGSLGYLSDMPIIGVTAN
jgi:hypothetical protein